MNTSIKILHLEDHAADAEQIAWVLKKAGMLCDVKVVDTRSSYIAALEEFVPQLIISDHNLPAFDSLEALRLLRKSQLLVPFILVTGTVSEEFAVEAMREGADDYILKDRMKRLPNAVVTALEKYELSRKQEEGEKRIKESETKYRSFFENSMDGILLTETDGLILAANPAACTMFQMTEQQICETGRFGLIDPNDNRMSALIQQRQLTGQARGELTFLRKDGSTFPGEISTSEFIHTVGEERTSMIIRDISERKNAEAKIDATSDALQKTLSDLKKVLDSSMDLICAVDQTGHFRQVSAASETILGYRPDELNGKLVFDFIYPEDRTRTEQSASHVMAGNTLAGFENRYVRKDGSLVTLAWSTQWDENDRMRYGVARDVTELKKAEKAIATERKRLSDLFMNAPVSMCILNGKDHVFELANPDYLKIGGKQGMNIIGKPVREVFPELVDQGLMTLLDNIYDSGEPFKVNEMGILIDRENNGELSYIYQNVLQQPYRDADGQVAGIFYFGVDVTEQVLARKKIEDSEKKYRKIVETAQEGIWLIDEKNFTTFVNKKMCEIIEYSEDELLGREIYHFMDDVSSERAKEQIERRKQGISEIHDSIFITKSKKSLWVSISTNPVLDEAGIYKGALAMITNITERKKFEATVLRRDYQLTLAAHIAKLGYWEYDIKSDLFTFNDQFYDIFKTSAEQVGGYTMTSARYAEIFVHPDDREIVNKSVTDAIKSDDSDFNFKSEHRIVYAHGEIGYISVHFRIVKDEKGNTIRNFGVNQDITERKKVELEKLALIEVLQAKNKDLQQFSYIVSHNLRAPIAKILGLVSVIENESDENKFLLEKLTEEATHLDDVVTDINTIVSARKSAKERMEPVLFESELSLIRHVLENEIAASGATIVADFSTAPGLSTIKSYFYSILYNLISNALKYRQPEVPLRIEIKTGHDDKFICMSIKDNGEGIDLVKNKAKIFGLYKRFHTGTVPGKGIGLNLVKTQTETLGGHVEVESELNKGTTFRIYLPKNHDTATFE